VRGKHKHEGELRYRIHQWYHHKFQREASE
jgi:hypothetical protein